MKVLLFCLPYAGGSAAIFNKWNPYLDPMIEIKPIELAGKGRRFGDPWYHDRSDAVNDVYQLIKDDIQKFPYAVFGHSLGSLITYELVQKIKNEKLPGPSHVFFSGSSAPHLKYKSKKYHVLNDEEFKDQVVNLGGTPPELFDHPELAEVFLPLLKNDFRLAEIEHPDKNIHPLDQDITVLMGREDELTSEQCEEWSKHTNQKCNIQYFNGGHFFLHDETVQIVKIINDTVLRQTTSIY